MNRQFCTASDAASKTIFVDIPINHYNGFLQKCEGWRGELDILKKAVVTHDLDGHGQAEILCEVMHAELLRGRLSISKTASGSRDSRRRSPQCRYEQPQYRHRSHPPEYAESRLPSAVVPEI